MQTSKEYLIHEWQIRAIEEGIAAAEKGEIKNLEEVKQYWEKNLQTRINDPVKRGFDEIYAYIKMVII